ncbi:rhomboid family intramembrane serine protease [Gordonia sp. NPDC003425]
MTGPQYPTGNAHPTGAQPVCYRHPDRPTWLSCSRCGRPACPECLQPAAVGQHCVDCRRGDGMQRTTVPTFGDQGVRPVAPKAVVARRPIATYGLIAINVAVFIACVIEARSFDAGLAPLFQHGDLVGLYVSDGQYWRLLTAGFLHFTVLHIAVNMISLYILGRDLEIALGIGRYLMVYFISLFGGSAAVMLFEANNVRSAGASGAIYGLMGAMLVVVLKARISPTPVLVIIGVNLALSFSMPGISVAAHVGGLVFGAAATAAVVYLPGLVLSPQTLTADRAARVGWIALCALLVVAIGIGVGAGALGVGTGTLVR